MRKKWAGWAILILGLVMVFRVGGNVVRLWKAGGWVKEAEEDVKKAEEENLRLKGQLAEVQTPRFLEQEAREKLGYGKPGEIVLVMPDQGTTQSSKLTIRDETANWIRWRKAYLGF
jgi:cell division protein FtsB